MLASARSSCARTLSLSRPAWSLALPAESSRQAAVRASLHAGQAAFVRPVHGGTKAPYSAAAVAVAEADQDQDQDPGEYGGERGFMSEERQRHTGDPTGYGEWLRHQPDVSGSGRSSLPSDRQDGLSNLAMEDGATGFEPRGAGNLTTDDLEQQASDVTDKALDPFLLSESTAPSRPDNPRISPAPPPLDHLPPLIQFRYTLSTYPRRALVYLGDMSTSDLKRLTLLEFDTFLHSLSKSFGTASPSREDIPDGELRALVRLHAALREYRDEQYMQEGSALHGKRLVRMLRACMFLGTHTVYKSVWKGRLADMRRDRAALADAQPGTQATGSAARARHNAFPGARVLNQVAEDLIKARDWSLARWLFQAPQMQLEWYTPAVYEAAVRTHQAYEDPAAVVQLSEEMEARRIRATPDVYCSLMQAHLQVGDVDMARSVLGKGRLDRELTSERVQIGILRGHMVLGGSAAVADRVMRDIASLEIEPSAHLLNTLISARLHDRDQASTLKLLQNFDFAGGKTEATAETYALTLKLHAQSGSIANLREVWHRLVNASIPLTSRHLQVVMSALAQAGPDEAEEGLKAIRAHIDRTPFSSWRIPRDLQLSTGIFNALINGMGTHHGIAGAERALRLMRRAGVAADDSTVQVLVALITKLSKSPVEGLTLLSQLRQRDPSIRPTSDTLDTAIGAALASYRRSTVSFLAADSDSADPPAGIRASGPFRRAIGPVLQSLQARQARSTSTTLAHRLHFEALVQGTATQSGVPDVRHVWSQMLVRGYEPSAMHILALIKGYTRSGAMGQAEETLKLASEQGIGRTVGMWMEMLTGWAEKGQLDKAEKAYKEICALGVPEPSASNYRFTRQQPAADSADQEESPLSTSTTIRTDQPDITAMTVMIRAYYRCGSFAQARQLAQSMIERFPKLDQPALITAVHALRLDNRTLSALHLVRKQTTELTSSLRRIIRNIQTHAFRTAAKNASASAANTWSNASSGSAKPDDKTYAMGSSYTLNASAAERAKVFHLASEILKRDDDAKSSTPTQRRQISPKAMRDRLVRAISPKAPRKRSTKKAGDKVKPDDTGNPVQNPGSAGSEGEANALITGRPDKEIIGEAGART